MFHVNLIFVENIPVFFQPYSMNGKWFNEIYKIMWFILLCIAWESKFKITIFASRYSKQLFSYTPPTLHNALQSPSTTYTTRTQCTTTSLHHLHCTMPYNLPPPPILHSALPPPYTTYTAQCTNISLHHLHCKVH